MKIKSALRKSKRSLPWSTGLAAAAALLVWLWPNWFSYIILGVATFAAIGDAINIIYITARTKRDPAALEREEF
jgi:hypothetical protein